MKGWLLDTNVLSELRKPRPNEKVIKFISKQPLESLFVSVVTFAEIRFGIEKLSDAAKRNALQEWLDHELRPLFENRVLFLNEDVLLQWRLIIETGRRKGHTFSHPDVLIAAAAKTYGLTVVTRNTREFAAAEVPVFNPWTD